MISFAKAIYGVQNRLGYRISGPYKELASLIC
jgi:hypothetical protein